MQRHVREVTRVVIRLLGCHDEAEDVVQDTFLAAFEGLSSLNEPSAFRGWILRIAVNKTRNTIRKKKFLRLFNADRDPGDADLAALADFNTSPEVLAELRVVDAILKKVPVDQKIAWMLRYVEGHTVRDVSRLCRCSMATANRRISAAQKKIAAAVNEEVLNNAK